MRRCLVSLFGGLLLTSRAAADNWPAWRGPHATGVCDEHLLPLTWSATDNLRWRVPLPGPGNSTPIVWGDRVFLTQSLDGGKRRALLAFARADGRAVYAHFASAGVLACDLDGRRLWHRDLGPVLHKWGNGSSPVLYQNLLFVYQGPGEPTFLTALDKHTGKTVWTKRETGINDPDFGSYSTPLLVRASDHDELILPLPGNQLGGAGLFKAYAPATGEELWRCEPVFP